MVRAVNLVTAPAVNIAPPPVQREQPSDLSARQLSDLLEAKPRAAKLLRAAGVASFDGWMTAIFAGVTILTGLTNASSLLLGSGMAVVAFVEFRGAARL